MTSTTTVRIDSLYKDAEALNDMTLDQLFAMKAKVDREVKRANAMQIGALGKLSAQVRARIRQLNA